MTRATALARRSATITRPGRWRTSMTRRATRSRRNSAARPINWRELLGIVRVCEVGGGRLRGKTVLVETDNVAARGAASKFSSKAADMQELVRRLLRLSKAYGFTLKVTHPASPS